MSAREAIALLSEEFAELATADVAAFDDGPLQWPGYAQARERARLRTGESESVVCGIGRLADTEAVLVSFEFDFLGGSLGETTGDLLVMAHQSARRRRLPLVSLIATGGSRMHEGMRALRQLQRVCRAAAATTAAGLPQIAVLRDPATGGGWAILGPSSDVIVALPGVQVGFAGSRVRPPDADPSAYTAQAQLDGGHIDAIVSKAELRANVAGWLKLLTRPSDAQPAAPSALGAATPAETGRAAVDAARAAERPHAPTYLDDYFDWRLPISGDRHGGTDPGMLCGFGDRGGRTIGYAAQCGTATTPAGFRTAARLIRLADRLGIPVLTLIDTPGAANDEAAEREGVGGAIAELFTAMARARVPVTSLLIGEGGSGGAMALAAPDNTWTTPDGYFSVIAPEAAAAILKRDPDDWGELADQLRLRPQDLVELDVVRGIVTHER